MTDFSSEDILLPDQRIGDPIPAPNNYLIEMARDLKFIFPNDRPWLPCPRPLKMRGLRMGCMCGGRFSYEQYRYQENKRKDKGLWVWLGQCPICQVIYWSIDVGVSYG